MSGVSIGISRPRTHSASKTLRRCGSNVKNNNVIVIDADSCDLDDIIFVDLPDSLPEKWEGPSMIRKDKKLPHETVICIDDDDDDDESTATDSDTDHSGVGLNESGSSSSGASTGRKSCPTSKNFVNATDAADEECQFVQENGTPVRLSKGKRTYSGKAPARNRYGLGAISENDSSDDDHLDCELMEDSSGKLQKQWEKAFFRRRQDAHSGQFGFRDHGSVDFSSRPLSKTNIGHNKADTAESSCSRAKYSPKSAEQQDGRSYEPSSSICRNKEKQKSAISSHPPYQKCRTKRVYRTSKEDEACTVKTCYEKASAVDEDGSLGKTPSSLEPEVDHHGSSRIKEKNFQNEIDGSCNESEKLEPCEPNGSRKQKQNLEPCEPCATTGPGDKENFNSEKHPFVNSSPTNQAHRDFTPSINEVQSISEQSVLYKKSSPGTVNGTDRCFPERPRKVVNNISSFCNGHAKDAQPRRGDSCMNSRVEKVVGVLSNSQLEDERDQQSTEVRNNLHGEREKHKETEEYKRYIEEEWASRQKELQLQAEEAQRLKRLRKRERAESMRLLDMERRQKQRLNEMHETQKKDEENMSLKASIRSEVTKELSKLESICHSMGSLLHSLGVLVPSWPHSSPNEVQSAYRRALLTFHPDRASRYDIRQQVEAEEKAKLIIHMKNKFLPWIR